MVEDAADAVEAATADAVVIAEVIAAVIAAAASRNNMIQFVV